MSVLEPIQIKIRKIIQHFYQDDEMNYMKQALTNSMALLLAKNSCTRMLQSCLGFKAPELLSGAHR